MNANSKSLHSQCIIVMGAPPPRAGRSFIAGLALSGCEAGGATAGAAIAGVPGAIVGGALGHTVGRIITYRPSVVKERIIPHLNPQDYQKFYQQSIAQ